MAEELRPRQRRCFFTGCALTGSAAMGLLAFPLLFEALRGHDVAIFSLACTLAVTMGVGAILALFSFR
jgi:hypothetical protein